MIHRLATDTIIKVFDEMGNKKYEKIFAVDTPKENTVNLIIKSKNGIILDEKLIPMRSYVAGFLKEFYRCTFNSDTLSPISFAGGTFTTTSPILKANASDLHFHGIRVGTGDSALNITDYSLDGLILQGTAAGQLSTGAMTISAPVLEGSSYRLTMFRIFTNNSGSPITIRNFGLGVSTITSPTSSQTILMTRDREDKNGTDINITLANGQSMEVKLNLYFDLSEGMLKNFASWFYSSFANLTSGVTGVDTDGDTVTINSIGARSSWSILEGANGTSYGIRVGTGNTLITLDDYQVEGAISPGTGAGQLTYSAVTLGSEYLVNGQEVSFGVSRNFTNNSGAQIIVRNYGYIMPHTGSTARILIIKKLIGNIVVNNGESFQILQMFRVVNV